MSVGDRVYSSGVMTVVVSVAVYAAMGAAYLVLTLAGRDTQGAGTMAIPLVTFLIGLVVMAAGWARIEYEQKGTPFHEDQRQRRNRARR